MMILPVENSREIKPFLAMWVAVPLVMAVGKWGSKNRVTEGDDRIGG